MSTVEEIEKAVGSLDRDDLSSFRNWFEVFDSAHLASQIEQDLSEGKLVGIARGEKAISEGLTVPHNEAQDKMRRWLK